MKHFKLRTDLTIEIYGKTLFRIEATETINKMGVKKGEVGGYVEKEENLSGNAWVYDDAKVFGNAEVYGNAEVSGNAKVFGNAEVYGNAEVSGNAWVYGDAKVFGDEIEKTNDLINITSNVGSYNITITPQHIKIGCQYHAKAAWFGFTDDQIRRMDGEKAVNWWKIWKPILKTMCEKLEEN